MERRRRRSKTIVVALAVIVLCMSLIVGGTFALFTDKVTVNNHLQAGTLKITLIRTAHSYKALDDKGYLATTSVAEEEKNVNDDDFVNVFDLPDGALIAPQSVLSATFEIRNNDTVAFDYTVALIVKDSTGATLEIADFTELNKQLTLELTDASGNTTARNGDTENAANGITVNGANVVEVGGKETFTVKLTFIDDTEINNLAQGQNVYFDIVVSATQVTERTQNP
ncbi:MAG: hypothetical protein J6N93_04695 [Clostridia bacterium]|nr:hypothetical protein [Clostridia bacterium]